MLGAAILSRARELHSFADDHLLIRATAEEIADHDRTGCDACAQLKRAGAAPIKPRDRIDEGQTGANRALDVMLVRLWVAEIGQHPGPREPAHHAAGPGDDRRAATLVDRDQCLQLLRIEPGRQRARVDKITDENRDLPALRQTWLCRSFSLVDLPEGFRRGITARVGARPLVPLAKEVATQCFGRRIRIDPQLLCEQIGAGTVLAKRRAVSALSAIELHQGAMDTFLQGIGRQQPSRDANAALDRTIGQMMLQQLGHGCERHFAESLTFRRHPALELGGADLEAIEKFAAIECDGLLQTVRSRLRN